MALKWKMIDKILHTLPILLVLPYIPLYLGLDYAPDNLYMLLAAEFTVIRKYLKYCSEKSDVTMKNISNLLVYKVRLKLVSFTLRPQKDSTINYERLVPIWNVYNLLQLPELNNYMYSTRLELVFTFCEFLAAFSWVSNKTL